MKPPDGIERLTPGEAWQDGYRAGRESLALAYQGDKEIREAKEGKTLERLDTIERKLETLINDSCDKSALLMRTLTRVKALEEGPKYLMTDEEVRRVAEVIKESMGTTAGLDSQIEPVKHSTLTPAQSSELQRMLDQAIPLSKEGG